MNRSRSANKKHSPVNIIEGVIITVLIVLIIFMLAVYFSFSKTGATPKFFGYTFYRTMAVNMETDIPAGTAIIAKASEIDNIKEGSVVLCKIGEDTVLTRVVQLADEDGVLSYVVKFDTAPATDTFKIPAENVIAKAVYQSTGLGSLLGFITSTWGIMLIIIIPSFIIIVFQVIRIINVKRKEEDASSLDDLDEIMRDSDNRFEEMFGDDIPADKEPKMRPIAREIEETIHAPSDDKDITSAAAKKDLGVVFTFENPDKKGNKSKHVVPKPKTPNTDNFFTYISDKADDQLYGGRIKRQEIVEDKAEEQTESKNTSGFFPSEQEIHKSSKPETTDNSTDEKNIPTKVILSEQVLSKQVADKQSAVIPESKPITEAKAVTGTANKAKQEPIRQQVSPKHKNNDTAISELMSMINAEESKLHK